MGSLISSSNTCSDWTEVRPHFVFMVHQTSMINILGGNVLSSHILSPMYLRSCDLSVLTDRQKELHAPVTCQLDLQHHLMSMSILKHQSLHLWEVSQLLNFCIMHCHLVCYWGGGDWCILCFFMQHVCVGIVSSVEGPPWSGPCHSLACVLWSGICSLWGNFGH